jgi:BASS family bile acid:Na+ symporter
MTTAAHGLHRHFLTLLVATYALAAVGPTGGTAVRDVTLGELAAFGGRTPLTLPMALLAVLLFNAGLGTRLDRLRALGRRPAVLAAGLAANFAVPLATLAAAGQLLRLWPNAAEARDLLVGLALVAAMPVAGSSAGWAQNAGGDTALSLGLILLSTLLSPLTTPAVLRAAGLVAGGDGAAALAGLAGGTGALLTACVLVPSAAGVAARLVAGRAASAAMPALKLVNAVIILVLCYANASACLPQALARPDWDFLGLVLAAVAGQGVLAFAAGGWVGRAVGADRSQRASLVFGLGMSNNGTGLVLAAEVLTSHPMGMLPVVAYNLVQHLLAGAADRALRRAAD